MPHDLRRDPRLRRYPRAIVLAATLLEYARAKSFCWPSNRRLAEDMGCCQRTVQLALGKLQRAGWVRVEQGTDVGTGRRIRLTWREGGCAPVPAPVARPRANAVAPEVDVIVKGDPGRETAAQIPERSRPESEPTTPQPTDAPYIAAPEPPPAPPPALPTPIVAPCNTAPAIPLTSAEQNRLAAMPAAARDQILTWLTLADPILLAEARKRLAPPMATQEPPRSLPELLSRIREDASYPAMAASALCRELNDPRSYAGYAAKCGAAWRGEIEPDRLVSAFEQACGPAARRRGAVFMHIVQRQA